MTACNRKIAERRTFIISVTLMAALLMLLAGLSLMTNASPSAAAPEAGPTPITNPVRSQDAVVVEWASAKALTVDTYLDSKQLLNYETLDLQYTVDQTLVNTTTVTIQFSNNGTNWTDGIAVVSANAADATNLVQLNNFGRYTRFKIDVTNTNPITWTVLAVAK